MTLQTTLSTLARSSARIGVVRDGLVEEHLALRARIDDLLDAEWCGQAAVQFRAAWTRWCEGMSGALTGLGLESTAIQLAGAELAGADHDRATAARLLQDRLGER